MFTATGTDIAEGSPANGGLEVYLRDVCRGTTTLVSRADGDGTAAATVPPTDWLPPYDMSALAMSADGRYVLFGTTARNLAAGTNGGGELYLRDVIGKRTILVSRGDGPNGPPSGGADLATMTPDARYVVFTSASTVLAPGIINSIRQVFRRELGSVPPAPTPVRTCGAIDDPGIGGTPAPPCPRSDDDGNNDGGDGPAGGGLPTTPKPVTVTGATPTASADPAGSPATDAPAVATAPTLVRAPTLSAITATASTVRAWVDLPATVQLTVARQMGRRWQPLRTLKVAAAKAGRVSVKLPDRPAPATAWTIRALGASGTKSPAIVRTIDLRIRRTKKPHDRHPPHRRPADRRRNTRARARPRSLGSAVVDRQRPRRGQHEHLVRGSGHLVGQPRQGRVGHDPALLRRHQPERQPITWRDRDRRRHRRPALGRDGLRRQMVPRLRRLLHHPLGPDAENLGSNIYWGILVNDAFTDIGGCQAQIRDDNRVLWAYDAFHERGFLKLAVTGDSGANPQPTTTVTAGQPVDVTVSRAYGEKNPNCVPIGGMTVAPVTTAANGVQIVDTGAPEAAVSSGIDGSAALVFTTPGWHRIKADGGVGGPIRSNRLDVCVVAVAGGTCGTPPADTTPQQAPPCHPIPSARRAQARAGARTTAPTTAAGPSARRRGAPVIELPRFTTAGAKAGRITLSWRVLRPGVGVKSWSLAARAAGATSGAWAVRAHGTKGTSDGPRWPADDRGRSARRSPTSSIARSASRSATCSSRSTPARRACAA